MKKIIITVMQLIFLCGQLKAQGLVYTPFIPQTSSPSYGNYTVPRSTRPTARPSSQVQTVQVTAYYADILGDYYKVPIRIEYTVYSNGASTIYVTEQWKSNSYSGGWVRISPLASIQECHPLFGSGNNAELEKSFMYKAQVGSRWYYFDL